MMQGDQPLETEESSSKKGGGKKGRKGKKDKSKKKRDRSSKKKGGKNKKDRKKRKQAEEEGLEAGEEGFLKASSKTPDYLSLESLPVSEQSAGATSQAPAQLIPEMPTHEPEANVEDPYSVVPAALPESRVEVDQSNPVSLCSRSLPTSPHLTSHHLPSPHLSSPHLTSHPSC